MNQPNDRPGGLSRLRRPDARTALAAALALAFAAAAGSASAATQVVSNCNDTGSGSLRAAITAAMSGDTVDATGLSCSTISLSTGSLVVTADDLKISGAGRSRLTVTNGAKYGRVIRHEGTGVLNLYGMTISGGVVSPAATEAGTRGGCIYSNGTVNLGNLVSPADQASGVSVADCTAVSTQANVEAQGGGIFARVSVGLANSTVTHSRAVAQDSATKSTGGGIFVGQGPFSMKYSEVSDCAASGPTGVAGGIAAIFVNQVTVTHSTIAGNAASARAGGAYLGTTGGDLVSIDNSTISGNTSERGESGVVTNVLSGTTPGAIHIYSSTVTGNQSMSTTFGAAAGLSVSGPAILQSTIVSGNTRVNLDSDLRLTGTSTGADNLVGVSVGNAPPSAGLITTTDPKLGPLANRGGPTRTHEPLMGSQAIDHGNNTFGSTTDQRGSGFARTLGATTDIGAVERNPDIIFANGFD
ncbi:MAG: choice-of-anchor Q domain-containing protein [Dokdonella sp.]|uniref:choice-of-anchor Q domain-containing protein n=1 Tax=Dokdonella sp. TaxID=2291710 RepID=UPI003267DEE5